MEIMFHIAIDIKYQPLLRLFTISCLQHYIPKNISICFDTLKMKTIKVQKFPAEESQYAPAISLPKELDSYFCQNYTISLPYCRSTVII